MNKGHDKIDKGGSLEDKTPLRNNSDRNENKEKDYNRGRPLQDKKKQEEYISGVKKDQSKDNGSKSKTHKEKPIPALNYNFIAKIKDFFKKWHFFSKVSKLISQQTNIFI